MEQAQEFTDENAVRVLASADAAGHEVKVVEDPSHSLRILFDGHAQPAYCWPAGEVDQCMRTYLGLLRHRPLV